MSLLRRMLGLYRAFMGLWHAAFAYRNSAKTSTDLLYRQDAYPGNYLK